MLTPEYNLPLCGDVLTPALCTVDGGAEGPGDTGAVFCSSPTAVETHPSIHHTQEEPLAHGEQLDSGSPFAK